MLVLSEPRYVLRGHELVVEAPANMGRHEVACRLMDMVGDMLKDRQAEAQEDENESAYLRLEAAERAVRFAASSVSESAPVEAVEVNCANNGNGELVHDLTGLDRRQFPLRSVSSTEERGGEQYDTLECGHVRSIPEGHPVDSASRRCGDCYVEAQSNEA